MKRKNIVWEPGKTPGSEREKLINQRGIVIWLTGLSGSGKSTIASELEFRLLQKGRIAFRLDGDNIRHGLNSDLGFSKEERNENIRRIAEVSKLFADAGVIAIVAAISPYEELRERARTIVGSERFYEVFVKADIETCRLRDPKGLYARAKAMDIHDFTGIDSPYEIPSNPDATIDTLKLTVAEAVEILLEDISNRYVLEKR